MQSFYDPASGSVEAHIDDAGFRLLDLSLPGWFISGQIKSLFPSRSRWDPICSMYPLSAAPGMASVLSSPTPPSIDYFHGLPIPSRQKRWAVYSLICQHPELPPILYIGSATNAEYGARSRYTAYLNRTGVMPFLVERAQKLGYSTTFGILCYTDVPLAQHVPSLRGRFLALESVFTIIFCACVKMIMDVEYIPDFFLWPRESMPWKPGCTHLSLSESVRADNHPHGRGAHCRSRISPQTRCSQDTTLPQEAP